MYNFLFHRVLLYNYENVCVCLLSGQVLHLVLPERPSALMTLRLEGHMLLWAPGVNDIKPFLIIIDERQNKFECWSA